jgi:hypothetical protein
LGVYPQLEVIFHVFHAGIHAVVQPAFEPDCIIIQSLCFCDAAMIESQLRCYLFDKQGMLM